MKVITYIFLFALLYSTFALGQSGDMPKNYRHFDRKFIHFGFMLGVNTADFSTLYYNNLKSEHNLENITNESQPGFQLGIISSMKIIHPSIRLRFIPSLSFQERILNYSFITEDGIDLHEERIGSTNLDFPLLFKLRTARYNNFSSYIITGAQYTLDLQTKEFSSQSPANPFLKIKRDDLQGQIGAGVDFFLPYFKFGIELKLSHGIFNTVIKDNTSLSNPIDRLYNRVWWLSFTFEG